MTKPWLVNGLTWTTRAVLAVATVLLAAGFVGIYRSGADLWTTLADGWWPRFIEAWVWGPWVTALVLWAIAGRLAATSRRRAAAGDDAHAPYQGPQPSVSGPLKVLQAKLLAKAGEYVDTVAFFERLATGAAEVGASDIHVQPGAKASELALRIDGRLEPLVTIAPFEHRQLLTRIKVLSSLVTYVTDSPQDGHLSLPHGDDELETRVSIIPTRHGERAVLRFVRPSDALPRLEELGLPATGEKALLRALRQPRGMVLLTGPTGSGKTTTIYAALAKIHEERGGSTHIATIEDPIELELPFVSQTQVHRRGEGLTFASGLRSLLRQDPDVLMVGEIRDVETGRTALQAGLSGHLILSSVHADCAAGVFNRLIELDLEPFLVASASLIVVSQRLVQRLCVTCREPTTPTAEQIRELEALGVTPPETVYESHGCNACEGRGYDGRLAVFEVLRVTDRIQKLIVEEVPTPTIHQAAVDQGMATLCEHGLMCAREGLTDLDEVLRVAQ